MRQLSFLEKRLIDAIRDDPERLIALARARAFKGRFRLPLVHRTGKLNEKETLKSIFRDRQLRPPERPSQREAELKLEPAVYFFYGAGAYAKGTVALVFHPEAASQDGAAFSVFDSGALATPWYFEPSEPEPGSNWDEPSVRLAFLEDHTGNCKDIDQFALQYLHAHFSDIEHYVVRPTRSYTDWKLYHGLKSRAGGADRRTWTIEVRIPRKVSFQQLQGIILDGEDLLRYVSDQMFDDDPEIIITPDARAKDVDVEAPPNHMQATISKFIVAEYF